MTSESGRIGPWRTLEVLHAGYNSVVYAASSADEDSGEAPSIALKVSSARKPNERYQRFLQEVDFHRSATDPGVLPLIDAYAPPQLAKNERAWLATPLAVPMRTALADASLEEVVQTVAVVAETLARLAVRDEHHRDVKPDNLFMLKGQPVVGDFGLVSFPEKPELTEAERPLGAIDFMAPEMRSNPSAAAGEPADVYGLVKTLWSLATRRVPVPGPIEAPQIQLRTLVPHPRAGLLDVIVASGTRFDPALRPSLGDIARELRAWLPRAEHSPSDAPVDLSELLARIRVYVDQDDARYASANELKSAANLMHKAITPGFHEVIANLPELHGSGGFQGTSMFAAYPALTSGRAIQQSGGATLRPTSQMPANLVAFFGVEARDDGLLRVVGGYALHPRGATRGRLLWHEALDFLPDGPMAELIPERIVQSLRAQLPAAVEAWAAMMEART